MQRRTLSKSAPAISRLPTDEVRGSGNGLRSPAREIAQVSAPIAKTVIMDAWDLPGPSPSIRAPRRNVATKAPLSKPSDNPSIGIRGIRIGDRAQWMPHPAAAHAAILDP